jgi:NAD(P)-dependent dehydrogenase (short-subunit alcohol dehydrogenase family)
MRFLGCISSQANSIFELRRIELQTMSEISSTTVLITGATDGLGRAAAILLANEGYRVVAGGRSADKLPLSTVEMDVTDDASVERALGEVRAAAGPVDVLVNNAGIAYAVAMEEIRLEDLYRQFETNFFAVVRVTQLVLPEMRVRRRGRIVNMSSVSGKIALPILGPYSSSKFALEGMTDALRLEVYPFGIEVVLIEPGIIRTNIGKTSLELSGMYHAVAAESPYAQVYSAFQSVWKENTNASRTTPEDCARVILRAMRDTPPKPRYPVTRRATMLKWTKRLLSDRMIDRQLLRSFGLKREGK